MEIASEPFRAYGELLLQMAEKAHLQEAFYDTNNSVQIGLEKLQSSRRNLVLSFARKLDSISDGEAEQISRILNKRRK